MTNETVYENDVYAVLIERDFKSGDDTMDVYGVYNKQTDVREAEMRTLPGAMTACDHLAAELAKLGPAEPEAEGTVIEFVPDTRTVN